MNDIRRSILWVVFGFSMVLIWDKWQIHNGQKPTFFPAPATVAASAAAKPAQADSSLPTASSAAVPPGSAAEAPTGAPAPAPAAARVDVTTDLFKLSFNTEGGSLIGTSPRPG